jgi:hypothetical protein
VKVAAMRLMRSGNPFMARMHAVTYALGWTVILTMIAYVVAPTFRDLHLLGAHEWDEHESFIYYLRKTILRFHRFPFWNPYTCGGYPAWAYFEGDNAVTSPLLPVYLTLALPAALRVEILAYALFSALGAWMLAGRFTRSPAARAFAVVLFAGSSRWSLEVAAGHAWHMTYCWAPWILYFLDRALTDWTRERRFPGRDMALAGGCLAMLVYSGGFYPLTQTITAAVVYSCVCSVLFRSWRPVLSLASALIVGFGLSAPRLLPLSAAMVRFSRPIDSPETMDLGLFVSLLTSNDRDLHSQPIHAPFWGWHEWGMYVGLIPALLLVGGLIAARGERTSALRWTALVLMALAFGSFHRDAPWALLHKLPIFQSEAVPSRWLYPALLVTAMAAVAGAERVFLRVGQRRPWLEAGAIAFVAVLAYDVAHVARPAFDNVFTRAPPRVQESMRDFHVERHLPEMASAGHEWASSTLPAEMANVGTVECAGPGPYPSDWPDRDGHARIGASGRGDPAYREEAYIVEGVGRAVLTHFAPDEMIVEIDGARPGHHVALNQNYDSGWRVNGHSAFELNNVVTAPIDRANETFVFRYRPQLWWPALVVFALTVSGLSWGGFRARKFRARGPTGEAAHRAVHS